MLPIVLGMTGASGAVYAVRLLDALLAAGHDVHLSISPSGQQVIRQELGLTVSLDAFDVASLLPVRPASAEQDEFAQLRALAGLEHSASDRKAIQRQLHYHHYRDFMTSPASGSFLTGGMVICPCSGATLSAIACGSGGNLIHRAAEVHLKERRPLILVPREAPLSLVQIENMRRVTAAGAVVLPAAPGWYHGVSSLADLVDFVVARVCDQLQVQHNLMRRWGENDSEAELPT